ncbi:MAG: hypothetical protein IKZ41_00040 [Clostridia bacterium]|nr:hypothetical protein [Clostridia bacterium]MBR5366261.1 hypothetical protein [Clostridia bacterium]
MTRRKTKKTVILVILIVVLFVLAAAAALLSNQFLIARVLEVSEDSVLVEVSNSGEYRWLDRLFSDRGTYEYIRLYVKDPAALSRGQFFAALTRDGQEDSDPPGIGARWIFR